MIAHLEKPLGIEMPKAADSLYPMLARLLVENSAELRLLDTGVYDITPKIWTKNNYNHELTVLDDGEGLYRLFPRFADSGLTDYNSNVKISDFKHGGRVSPIDATQPIALVTGGHPNKQGLHLFSVIAYLPNASALQ